MSTSTSWKLFRPSACWGGVQGIRPGPALTPPPPPHPTPPPEDPHGATMPGRAGPAHIPGIPAAGGPPAPQSGLCSAASHGWTRRPHPPCRGQAQELGSHSPHPSLPPRTLPGTWVSLEPGRVDLQDLLGAGQSANDPGLGNANGAGNVSGPWASTAFLLGGPTTPDLSRGPGVASQSGCWERLQLEALRVLRDVVGPQRRLLGGGVGVSGARPPWVPAAPQGRACEAAAGSLLPAPPDSWPGGGR